MLLEAQDNDGNVDIMSAYAVATPLPPPPDTEAPTVGVASPASGQHVAGDVPVTANATDNVGVTRVDFYLDSTGGPPSVRPPLRRTP